MAAYITGDIHRSTARLAMFCEEHMLTTEDIIVLLGDVGSNYYLDQRDIPVKEALCQLGVQLLCIHGNHEERPEVIESYHEVQWHGGTVYVEDAFPNLLFAKDGEVYDLAGHNCIAIGGAYSPDKEIRLLRGWKWFPDEQPSDAIKARVEKKLEHLSWKVDAVLTHTCPESYIPVEALLSGIDQSTVDSGTEEWLGKLEKKLDYHTWYCGHFHCDASIGKVHFLYNDWKKLESER